MKNLYLLVLMFLVVGALSAQPTIPQDSGKYVHGTSYTLKEVSMSSDMNVGSAGGPVLWDFSSLTATDTRSTNVDSAETSSILHDIVANMKVTVTRGPSGTQTQTYYYNLTPSSVEYSGLIDVQEPIDLADNPVTLWTWPMKYQDSENDVIDSKYEYGQTPFTKKWHYLSGSSTSEIDGYGRVKLPFGEVFEVLRVKTVFTYTDSIDGGAVNNVTHTFYEWRNPRNHIFVAQYEKRDYAGTVDRFYYYLDEADLNKGTQPASLAEMDRHRNELLVYPNPVEGQFSISYDLSQSSEVSLKLYDLHGKQVRDLFCDFENSGVKLHSFELGDLPSGIYQLRMEGKDFHRTKKLFVR
jgi:hypothetical protein